MSVKERGKKLKGQLTAKILLLNDEVRQTEAKPPAPAPHHVASKEFYGLTFFSPGGDRRLR